MSSYRKKICGAQFRKSKVEESLKNESLLQKIPKISNFMTSSTKCTSNDNDQQASGSSIAIVSILMQLFIIINYFL